MYGIYVHIPFCNAKCHYCDFLSGAGSDGRTQQLYAACLMKEVLLWKREGVFQGPPETVFFGGGTPTVLPPETLAGILETIGENFGKPSTGEVTVEANPGAVDGESLALLRRGGFTRLSFGVQAYQEELLKKIGRIHTWDQVVQGVQGARQAGYTSLNLDLIYGLPGQTPAQWEETLERALGLEPDHLSLYGLKVEEGTPFARWEEEGRLDLPAEEEHIAMYEKAMDLLAEAGFEHYEISNWAKPGHQSRHNRIYWECGDYLGLGLGASSHRRGHRWRNLTDLDAYTGAVTARRLPVGEEERLTLEERIGEELFLAHRLLAGYDWSGFRQRWGIPVPEELLKRIEDLGQRGLLERKGDVTRLSRRGLLLSNEVFLHFLFNG